MAIFRTYEFKDLTPDELAEAFCGMWAEEQASFFAAVWKRSKDWPGAGWCQQSCSILQSAANHSERDAFEMIRTLASHLPADDVAYIVAGSADASAMSAGTAETAQQSQGEARQRDPQGDAQSPQPIPNPGAEA